MFYTTLTYLSILEDIRIKRRNFGISRTFKRRDNREIKLNEKGERLKRMNLRLECFPVRNRHSTDVWMAFTNICKPGCQNLIVDTDVWIKQTRLSLICLLFRCWFIILKDVHFCCQPKADNPSCNFHFYFVLSSSVQHYYIYAILHNPMEKT